MDSPLGIKFVRKYMKMAELLATDQNPCPSRSVGAVIVRVYEDGKSRVVGTGYNGPPSKIPHAYTKEYAFGPLKKILKPCDYDKVREIYRLRKNEDPEEFFLNHVVNTGCCPRRALLTASGERLEICPCVHAEANAIANAGQDLHGCWMFIWCNAGPCSACTGLIINSGIKRVYWVQGAPYYSQMSQWLLTQGGVEYRCYEEAIYKTTDDVKNGVEKGEGSV